MNAIAQLLKALYHGEELVNAKAWKNGAISATALLAVLTPLLAAARGFGLNVPLSDADLAGLAGGVAVVINLVVHVAGDKNMGLQPRAAPDAESGSTPRAQGEPGDQPDIRDPGGA